METLAALALLACPLGMGAMMWFMARGHSSRKPDPEEMPLTDLHAERRRLDAQLARAERREEVPS